MSPELQRLLDELRGRIRRYVAIEGTALLLVVIGLSFWLSFSADVAHFSISKSQKRIHLVFNSG